MFKVKDFNTGELKLVTRSRAIVTNNVDPEGRGRIKVKHTLLGETNWIPYLTHAGVFSMPEPGDLVYIEADSGFETNLIAWGNFNRTDSSGIPATIPEEFARNAPTNRGFYSPGGILVQLDDGDGPLKTGQGFKVVTPAGNELLFNDDLLDPTTDIKLVDKTGNEIVTGTLGFSFKDYLGNSLVTEASQTKLEDLLGSKLQLSPSGIVLEDYLGSSYKSEASGITITDLLGSSYSSSASGIKIIDLFNNQVETSATGIKITDINNNVVDINLQGVKITTSLGSELKLTNGQVDVGNSATTILTLLNDTLTAIQALTVGTAVGVSSPPVNIAQFAAIQAQLALLKAT